uniref:Uncharacterized protein n=1 Tax=Anolis carolinensis TaxID=28377 RepID=A0A803T2D3_ANOCA
LRLSSPLCFLAEESPSTASTTPDSTDGGNDESDFPELQTAREFSEDEEEEEASVEWGTPRELTFSYITIATPNSGGGGAGDSHGRRARAPLPRTETCETFVPALGDSLENIPSLCPSPETGGPGLDPFAGWEAHSGQADTEGEEHLASQPHSPAVRAEERGPLVSPGSGSFSVEVGTPPQPHIHFWIIQAIFVVNVFNIS